MKAWLISGMVLAAVVAVGCDGDEENPTGGSGGSTTTTTSLTGSGGGGGDTGTGGMGTGGSFPDTVCGNYCHHLSEVNPCPNDSPMCVEQCDGLRTIAPWCGAQYDAVFTCAAQEPASSYECSQGGNPEIKDDVCVPEQAGLYGCWYEGEPGGLPDMTADCQAYCDAAAGLACASANCLQECLDSMADAQPCNGAQAMTIRCFAQQPASAYECSSEQKPQPTGFECFLPVALHDACMQ